MLLKNSELICITFNSNNIYILYQRKWWAIQWRDDGYIPAILKPWPFRVVSVIFKITVVIWEHHRILEKPNFFFFFSWITNPPTQSLFICVYHLKKNIYHRHMSFIIAIMVYVTTSFCSFFTFNYISMLSKMPNCFHNYTFKLCMIFTLLVPFCWVWDWRYKFLFLSLFCF